MSHKVKVAFIQMKMSEEPALNLKKALSAIHDAAKKKAKIICLPELFLTEYFPRVENKRFFKLAESIPGPTTQVLSQVAKQLKVVIVAPLFEKRTSGLYHNTIAVMDADGKYLGKYRKMHIPDDPNFYEKYYFTPGDLGFKVFDTHFGRLGMLICWDQWYPEAARLTTLKGAQILFYPTAIGWHSSETNRNRKLQQQAWRSIQQSHAISNGVFVVSANRVGKEKSLSFWGSSFICAPDGEMLCSATSTKSEIGIATCDLKRIETFRQEWPFLRDRRIDAYQSISTRYLD